MSGDKDTERSSHEQVARRMEEALRRAVDAPQRPPVQARTPKPKMRPASKGRAHKAKSRS
jgi:hypothetical protein